MIFLSVGTQLPFDRLVTSVDTWASRAGRQDVIAQIGPSTFHPSALTAFPFISPAQFDQFRREARVIIAHAGMGSIIGALELGKPIVVMPRRAHLGEHRSDHQLATAECFKQYPGVWVAVDVEQLNDILSRVDEIAAGTRISPYASDVLIRALRQFIEQA